MRVGVIELLIDEVPSRHWLDTAYRAVFKKQYASIMPQAVAVWCRQHGHEVHYATYYGQREPDRLLPDDLDVLFVAAYTQASALGYVLAKLYRARGTLTVIGGPHAKSFPHDCLRFFDIVVGECDRQLVEDIVRGTVDPGSIVGSGRPLTDIPSVEERMPEIRASAFVRGWPVASTTVSLLSSIGCPYRCDFCIDWDTPYALLSPDRLEADLRYLATHWPGVLVAYHDPNFGVQFDRTLSSMEEAGARNRYIMESSLSVLRGPRLARLRRTNCIYVAPGVESWTAYSNKAGLGRVTGAEKLVRLVERFRLLHEHGLGLQANFIFGTDGDHGPESAELTREFIRALPFVWPTVNVPTPFGGTPLYDTLLAEDRVIRSLPFTFYYTPYVVMTLRHNAPVDYYQQLIDLYGVMTSGEMLRRRLRTGGGWGMLTLHALRTFGMRQDLSVLRLLRDLLRTDRAFSHFHAGCSTRVPGFYLQEFERKLGRYAALLSPADRIPVHEEPGGARDAGIPGPCRI